MPIGDFCQRDVVVAEPGTSVVEAAQLMRRYHVGSLVIVDSMTDTRRPVGILTDRDLVVEVLAKEVQPEGLTVGDLLIGELATVPADAGIPATLQTMRTHGCRRMPIVDAEGRITGIVSFDDLLGLLADELAGLAELARDGQQRESARRP